MLPVSWEKKLVDINVETLRESHIKWADLVFISAMSIQSGSVKNVIAKCRKAGAKTVAGGPLFTAYPEKYGDVDFLVLGEAEMTLPMFLEDFKNGCPKHVYMSKEWADITKTPAPAWGLINAEKYSSMSIQYSRGCPFCCEFCEIVVLYGNRPRVKDTEQLLEELDSLYDTGWRGSVFFVDDNFIGNKEKLKESVLPALVLWSEQKGFPFVFYTEASVNLADDDELMRLMVSAGFDMVFIGIETPHKESLIECNKHQNRNRDLLGSVDRMQRRGLQVQGGFIIGFDSDPESIFDMMIKFIQQSGIIVAMVGLLNAPRGTKLYERLKKQDRLISDSSGNNTDCSMNFRPKMQYDKILSGYRKVVGTVYSPKYYYERIAQYLGKIRGNENRRSEKISKESLAAFFRSVFRLGIAGKERIYFWKLVFKTLFTCPSQLPKAVAFAVYGYHFRKIYKI